MIGLSLSLCVLDVIEGKVDPNSIEKIVTGTAYPSRDEFIRGINDTYCRTYWRHNPSRAFCLALDLWDQGKLDQPRLDPSTSSGQADAPNTSQGHWVVEDASTWRCGACGCVFDEAFDRCTQCGVPDQCYEEPQDEP
jgi:hypothetical protein